jgi:hypothetical protein
MRILLLLTKLILIFYLTTSFCPTYQATAWGFFGHKRINRFAVFTLPTEVMGLYKQEIDYITDHAIDPDKRRFVINTEGYRHYINLDKGRFFPRDRIDAQILFSDIFIVTENNDTLQLIDNQSIRKNKRDYIIKSKNLRKIFFRDSIAVADSFMRRFFMYNLSRIEPEEAYPIVVDSLKALFKKEALSMIPIKAAFAKDYLIKNGILPYHLYALQRQITEAFMQKDRQRILKLSAEMGHYMGDAHVPLHTTANYDGQFTKQTGIHAFWESRLPELFTDARYDFIVGRAEYIQNPKEFFWKIILDANKLVNKVLDIEKEINAQFSDDKKYCIETINGVAYQKPCAEYAELYHDKLEGMVEEQMRNAILALGSAWYTAWVDAGQPDLDALPETPIVIEDKKILVKADSIMENKGQMIGRDEGKQK